MHYVTVKGILSAQNGMNLYRGCTHGCIYCDSRSTCYQMNHDFEDIEVKTNAVDLLEQTLRPDSVQKMSALFTLLDETLSKVPVYRFCCDISKEAVMLSYNTMKTN